MDERSAALAAVTADGTAYLAVSDKLKCDKTIILRALETANVMSAVPRYMQDDKDIALAAVRRNPWELLWVSYARKDDFDVVHAAVRGDGRVLQWASERLCADARIAQTAVHNDIRAQSFVRTCRRLHR